MGKRSKGGKGMSNHGGHYLIEQLLNNNLSEAELGTFLTNLHDTDAVQGYSEALELYFSELLQQNEHPSDADQRTT